MTSGEFDPTKIERPNPSLLRYYLLVSFLTGPLTPLVFLPLYFRFATLRYKFDEDGVSMSWGILFRKEVYLTYRRIQDIHITRNLLQRWMGLAKISLQTAAGSSQAEMAIEGILQPDLLRDFLYSRMRGAKGDTPEPQSSSGAQGDANYVRATQALVDIKVALEKLVEQKQQEGELR